MQYRLIGKNNILDPIGQILRNRGIKDVDSHLTAGDNPKSEHHFSKLKNIEGAVDCLVKHINEKNNIFVQIDPDADGIISSAILIDYLRKIDSNINIQWRHQDGKEHGIKSEYVPDDIGLVIVPDSGSSDFKEHKKLHSRGKDVLIIDHHEIEGNKESEHAIVVNNQLGDYPNRHLSGAGVVYKVIQALDNKMGILSKNNYLDLVAVSIIADMMDLRDKENMYYITQGLAHVNNPMLKQMFVEQNYSTRGVKSPTTVSYYIAPLINAVIRSGTAEEKNQLFESFLCDGSKAIYYERGEKYESFITNTIRMTKRVRQQQNTAVDKSMEEINSIIEKEQLLENKLLVANVTNILDESFTGLTANKLREREDIKRPVLLLRYNEEDRTFSGSARGYENGQIKDFKQFLLDTGYFEYCRGHDNAFGVKIKKDKLPEMIQGINKKYKDMDFGSNVYDVDFVLNKNTISKGLIEEIDKHYFLWGKDIEEPLVAVESVEIERRNLHLIGANRNHLKFANNGIEYIKFFIDEPDHDNLLIGDSTSILKINIIGRASINEFRGYRTPQIIIEDFEVVEVKEREFMF